MSQEPDFLIGEFPRSLDERYRVSLPADFADPISAEGDRCILAKERPGCLSLWAAARWEKRMSEGVELVKQKMRAGRLEGNLTDVQLFGRLLSTRQREVQLAGRGRLLVPESFRSFLGVEPGGEVLLVGAAVCIELWQPEAFNTYLEKRIPRFRRIFDKLSS